MIYKRLTAKCVGVLMAVSAFGVARHVRADERPAGYLGVGALFSRAWGHDGASGTGAEVSFTHWPVSRFPFGLGPFAQIESYHPDARSQSREGRYAAGFELATIVGGLELGYAYRSASGSVAGGSGVHFAFFASLAWISLGLRTTLVGRNDTSAQFHSSEFGVELALKLPIQLYGTCMKLMHTDTPLVITARCR
jgi:hypothetical protein